MMGSVAVDRVVANPDAVGLGRRRVCLFAEYGPEAGLAEPAYHYLEELTRAGFVVQLACSGRARLSPADAARLDRLGVVARTRANRGLDFGAWAELVADGAADGADEVLLANDSVLGPFLPLAPMFDEMAGFDAWGTVQSREGRPHLQSWFVWMDGDAFRRPEVKRVFAQDFAAMSKPEIIAHGEFGLAAAFEAARLDVGARYRAPLRLRPGDLVATNPMHFRWRQMLRGGRVPFLKVELLRDNPAAISDAHAWARELDRLGWGRAAWLQGARSRLGARRAPRLGVRRLLFQLALRGDVAPILAEAMRRPASSS